MNVGFAVQSNEGIESRVCNQGRPEPPSVGGPISAIAVLFLDHPKCWDSIFIYSPGLMISIGTLRLMEPCLCCR